jgi:chromosome segregation protein
MRLKSLEIAGFKSFAKKEKLDFESSICAIVGPNGSGKSNIAESFRFVLGEQSMKSMRGKRGEDLIFNGNNKVSRQNRASVKLVFDNKDKLLKIDFDEVEIERVVNRDGVNEYSLNGSKVRLKDVQELLASANIGSSGHHIVSQGDADRILNTSIKERKMMLQDALGLRVFEYKKIESVRKLEKTVENIKEVESLRREIAPHIKFLKKQIEKVEKAKELQLKLKDLYIDYLSREDKYIKAKEHFLSNEIVGPDNELKEINHKIDKIKNNIESHNSEKDEKTALENKLNLLRIEKGEIRSKISEVNGQINSFVMLIKEEENKSDSIMLSKKELGDLDDKVSSFNSELENSNDAEFIKNLFKKFITEVDTFIRKFIDKKTTHFKEELDEKIKNLESVKADLEIKFKKFENSESEITKQLSVQSNKEDQSENSQLEVIELMNRKNHLEIILQRNRNELNLLNMEKEELKREISEGLTLVGRDVINFEKIEVDNVLEEDRNIQKSKRKELERTKIRLEEMGVVGGNEIIKEYEDVSGRDQFLETEINDLKNSSVSLQNLIKELEDEIAKRFKDGLDKINKEFTKYFALMFGGGDASLKLVIDDARVSSSEFEINEVEPEEGIDITVSLPRKKIKGLMMLSGGERALVSIALLFAMASVNPPPFIILDETDAALDEANSRKYADMIEFLSKDSQLILITHNRETMSRAGTIYGVTMTEGMSQVLSIKFDEAVRVAK